MPIRTHRGRSAVYRQVWGWPLRSLRHLAATVIALVALGAGLAIVLPDRSGPEPPGAAVEDSARAGAHTGTDAAPDDRPLRPNAPPEALAVAKAWAQAWVTHPAGITPEQWSEQLRPYTTSEYLVPLRTVDPANIPSNAVTGEPLPVAVSDGTATVDVPTDGALLRLTVTRTVLGWRVELHQQAG